MCGRWPSSRQVTSPRGKESLSPRSRASLRNLSQCLRRRCTHCRSRMRPIMSIFSMATALSSGRVGSFTHSAEPSSPSSSPANDANKIPRGSCPLSGASMCANSTSSGGARSVVVRTRMNLPDLRRRERIVVPVAQVIVMRAENHVLVAFPREVGKHIVHRGARVSRRSRRFAGAACSETRTKRACSTS